MISTYKLAFIGAPGAGKTTCIGALSDIPPVSTDVGCTDELLSTKATTTVAFDYGEMDLGDDGRLLLYGLPGQARFRYMFEVVREGLLGVIILIDGLAEDGLEGLLETLETYSGELRNLPCILAINKHPNPPETLKQECLKLLRNHHLVMPILSVDARRKDDIATMFQLLFMQLEYGFDQSEANHLP